MTQRLENHEIARDTLHDKLLARLRTMIMDGELPPGSKVPETELCKRFGISRTPLREALKVLAAEQLVTLSLNRGAVVSELTLQDLEESFPIMASLEALSGELACRQISDEAIRAIRDLHERMRAEHLAGNVSSYFALNRQIHESILAAAGNQLLAALYQTIFYRVRRARLICNLSIERRNRAMEEHDEIIAALEARDGERLAEIMKRHIGNLLAYYRQALKQNPEALG